MSEATLQRSIVGQPHEAGDEAIVGIEGTIPEDLRGVFIRTGPGPLTAGGHEMHFLDGVGLPCALRFAADGPHFQARRVRSKTEMAEQERDRFLFRRFFTNLPGRWRNLFRVGLANSVNHDTYVVGDRILATDSALHWELDRRDLGTKASVNWNGLVGTRTRPCPMPRADLQRGTAAVYVLAPGVLRADHVRFGFVGANFELTEVAEATLDRPGAMIHDLAYSEHYYVVIEQPAHLRFLRFLWGKAPAFGCFDWLKAPARLVMASRDGKTVHKVSLPEDLRILFHIVNAYEEDGKLVVDALAARDWITFTSLYPPALAKKMGIERTPFPREFLVRFAVDLERFAVETTPMEWSEGGVGTVAPDHWGRPYRYVYMAGLPDGGPDGADPFLANSLTKTDLQAGTLARWPADGGKLVSQPGFCPRPNPRAEDDGYALVWLHDPTAHRSRHFRRAGDRTRSLLPHQTRLLGPARDSRPVLAGVGRGGLAKRGFHPTLVRRRSATITTANNRPAPEPASDWTRQFPPEPSPRHSPLRRTSTPAQAAPQALL